MNKKEISMATKKRLSKLFVLVGESEQHLEFARQNLCKAAAFEPYASFQRIDRQQKGYLTSRDLLNFLKDNGQDQQYSEQDGKHVIRYFDSTGEGRLFYTDYLQILLPCDQSYLRAAATQRPTYPISQKEYLPYEVERLLTKVISKELKCARDGEILKQELASRYDYHPEHLFREVDDWNYKFIDIQNLKRYLIKTGVFANEALLICIIRRFDLDADAKLNFKEFAEGILPLEEYSKRSIKEKNNIVLSSSSKTKELIRSSSKSSRREFSMKQQSTAKKQSILNSMKKSQQKPKTASYSNQRKERSVGKKQQRILDESRYSQKETRNIEIGSGSMQRIQDQNSPLRIKQEKLGFNSTMNSIAGEKRRNEMMPSSPLSHQTLQYHSEKVEHLQKQTDLSLQKILKEYIKEALALEGSLEDLKREIAVRQDFTLQGAFNMFTSYSSPRISANDLLFGLERLGVVCDIADAKLIVERYDQDQDGRLSFWELSNAFLPIEVLMRDDLERKKSSWEIGYETKELVRRLFRKIVDSESIYEMIRQGLDKEKEFVSIRKAFDSIDYLGRGFITETEIKRVYESQYGQLLNGRRDEIELEGLIRRFNKDKLNGRISIQEFLYELTPKYPQKPY